jgi:nucleotide-binding universal stress UspA family protein
MKKVLIAIDDTPNAQKIAEAGYLLAKAINGRTILLHVIPNTPFYSSLDYSLVMGSEGFDKAIEKIPYEKFEDVVEDYLHKVKDRLDDERIQTVVRCGDPH